MKIRTWLTSLGLGAGLMYFYDPRRGELRRTRVRDRVGRVVSDVDHGFDTARRDLRNRTRGTLAEWTARLDEQSTGVPDWILEERVRARLGRMLRGAGLPEIRAENGRVIMSGPVLRQDAETLMKNAGRTRGVQGVENHMDVYDSLQDLPAIRAGQTVGYRSGQNGGAWSPGMRLLAGTGGGLLAMYGMTRRGLTGTLASAAGLAAIARSVTNLDTRSLLGLGMGANAIKVEKAINIEAPIDEVYRFWQNFENFPRFMSHVRSIETSGKNSTWTVAGPGGTQYTFQARTTRDIPNQLIEWETQPDSDIHHHGTVRFDENASGGTRVSVHMQYVPPAGAVGHAVAALSGMDPRQAMNDDLMRLKTLMEDGQTSNQEKEAYMMRM